MWNASAQGAEQLALEGEGWRERLRYWALVQREMIDRHPWITQMPMAAPPMAPNSLRFVEHGLEALAAAAEAGTRPAPSFEALLRELVDEPTFPRLHRIASSGSIGPAPQGFEEAEEFRWGLERILDGIASLIRGKRSHRRGRSPS